MPRMSKKRKTEWAFFLNERNRITYNELCRRCINSCKQSFRVIVIECQRYISKRALKDPLIEEETESEKSEQESHENDECFISKDQGVQGTASHVQVKGGSHYPVK